MKMIYRAAMLSVVAIVPGHALACDAAGENTHVGQVLSTQGNQFTIRDAQSGGPLRFTLNAKGALPVVGERVAVKYSTSEYGLQADSIR
jgi:hypothetical protein